MKITLEKYISFILVVLLHSGCLAESPPRVFLGFIDYSLSASTFEANNKDRLADRFLRLWSHEMSAPDQLMVYPIHLLTETASSLYRKIKPNSSGDLNGASLTAKSNHEFLSEFKEGVFEETKIPDNVRMGTNLYPILRKIQRHSTNTKIRVLIVSDMIHEFQDEQLNKVFFSKNAPDPRELAYEKCQEMDMVNKLSNAEVSLLFPGTIDGDINDEVIRPLIITFWKELFTLAGATVEVEDL